MISWKRVRGFFPENTLMVVAGGLAALAGTAGCGSARSVPAMRYYANLIPGEHEQWFQDSIPYQSYPELIGIPGLSADRRPMLPAILDSLGLEDVTSQFLSAEAGRYGYILRRKDGKAFDRMNDSTLRTLRGRGIGAGPIITISDDGVTVFSHVVYLKPAPSVSQERLRAFMREEGGSELKRIAGVQDNHYMVLDPGMGEGINDVVLKLLDAGLVTYAYAGTFDPPPHPLDED